MKYNKVSKKFNSNLTASSTHCHYQKMEMFEIWSVRLWVCCNLTAEMSVQKKLYKHYSEGRASPPKMVHSIHELLHKLIHQ